MIRQRATGPARRGRDPSPRWRPPARLRPSTLPSARTMSPPRSARARGAGTGSQITSTGKPAAGIAAPLPRQAQAMPAPDMIIAGGHQRSVRIEREFSVSIPAQSCRRPCRAPPRRLLACQHCLFRRKSGKLHPELPVCAATITRCPDQPPRQIGGSGARLHGPTLPAGPVVPFQEPLIRPRHRRSAARYLAPARARAGRIGCGRARSRDSRPGTAGQAASRAASLRGHIHLLTACGFENSIAVIGPCPAWPASHLA